MMVTDSVSWASITRTRSRKALGLGRKTRLEYDHTHKGERVRFYDYEDAVTLLTDFWTEVDKILEERITKP
jgi:hypothetical protein